MRAITKFIPLLVSGYFIWLGWGYYSKMKTSESWPVAAGKVLHSEVAEARTRAGATTRMYEARVTYEYEVDGQTYKGDQIGFMDGSSSNRSDAAVIVNARPVGKEVPVYYDPANPHEACLERKTGKLPWLMMGGGGLGLLFGARLLVFGGGRRTRRGIHLG
ncbi:uncharacterized protein DUF3592 [Prosthecobacter fusiformis]|uniref:Uncharacterized protein DUF3592 n=1 Tax=Prosthecobacter fusiformis TaxID=48464 RepID=A0A4R7RPG1_9BACT|nr:DUF3592 domain-containing protein [Prosthecobacter fusiformis]TDU66137.1 uncharacterized protein DUF3592 [Prosthecobacter fusiformis]